MDAAQAGASFMEGFCVEKVLFTNVNGRKVASGVQGTWKSRDSHLGLGGIAAVERKVIIKAKKVVISAGTLQSPLLLLRSGLNNPQIGRNLYLHPGKHSPAFPHYNPHYRHLLFVTQLWELVLSLMRRLTPGKALHSQRLSTSLKTLMEMDMV